MMLKESKTEMWPQINQAWLRLSRSNNVIIGTHLQPYFKALQMIIKKGNELT